MSEKEPSSSKPIVNTLGGMSIIGTPNNDQILVFDNTSNSFKYEDKPSSISLPLPLDDLAQESASDGQVLTWSDANSQFEPQDP